MRFARRPTPSHSQHRRPPPRPRVRRARAGPAPAASAPGPTLAEVFGEKPLDGLRPTDAAISADGRFASYRQSLGVESRGSRPRFASWRPAAASRPRLAEVDTALWLPNGARLAWCSGHAVKVWEAGTPIASAAELVTFPGTASAPRLTPTGSDCWSLATGRPGSPRSSRGGRAAGHRSPRGIHGRSPTIRRGGDRPPPAARSQQNAAPLERAGQRGRRDRVGPRRRHRVGARVARGRERPRRATGSSSKVGME